MKDQANSQRVLIIGGGPTGLGAAWRLRELAHKNWDLYEASDHLGGLAASFKDDKGFYWDTGGHMFFSKIPYYNNFFEKFYKGKYYTRERVHPVLLGRRFIPYPFQNHIRYLPAPMMWECLEGVIEATKNSSTARPKNFLEFNEAVLGKGICKYFMTPYNRKVWAWPPEEMSYVWIAERVSVVDLKKLVEHVALKKDGNWGPNATYHYPKYGGFGGFWKPLGAVFGNKIHFKKKAVHVDFKKKEVRFSDDPSEKYDALISTIPIPELLKISNAPELLKRTGKKLVHNSGYLIGFGIRGKLPKMLHRMEGFYLAEPKWLFQKGTILHNYSPHTVPQNTWSVFFEGSHSPKRQFTFEEFRTNAHKFLHEFRLVKNQKDIVSVWEKQVKYYYPVPTLDRDKNLAIIQKGLLERRVYSVGRLGAWRYEESNSDHSFVMGVRAIDKIFFGKALV